MASDWESFVEGRLPDWLSTTVSPYYSADRDSKLRELMGSVRLVGVGCTFVVGVSRRGAKGTHQPKLNICKIMGWWESRLKTEMHVTPHTRAYTAQQYSTATAVVVSSN